MRYVLRVLISVFIIVVCGQIGRKQPSLAGLIAVMPLTGVIVLVWLYTDNIGNWQLTELMVDYCKGALWGIIPSILFFLCAFICFRKSLSLWIVLSLSFFIWLLSAFVHQYFLHK